MAEKNTNLILSFYGGAGIGLLFGIIMGTSTTPTVGLVLGALTAVLAAILGLNDKHFTNAKAVRIGSFGLACVVGAYAGLYVRSHNLLSPSPETMKAQYIQLGFSEAQALELILYKEFGATASDKTPPINNNANTLNSTASNNLLTEITLPTNLSEKNTQQHNSLLFSANVNISGCDELSDTDASLDSKEVINNFKLTGGIWQHIANQVSIEVNIKSHAPVLLATKDAMCNRQGIAITQADCGATDLLDPTESYQQVQTRLSNRAEVWKELASKINQISAPDQEKSHALILIKNTICHDGKLG
ncbi:hypothetical protein MNBD_GAMMA17-1208 [hydrothermal vent metagenome]|uniref:Uncharacterized protein n=1 Tax=hydrothermal vent metagenome TaxID=652676 RepID=A0A3B1A2K7_9ZZZZ